MGEQLKEEGTMRKMRVRIDGEHFDVDAVTPEDAEKAAIKMREDREKESVEAPEKAKEEEKEEEKEDTGEQE